MKVQNKSVLLISIPVPLVVDSVSALLSGNMSSYVVLNKLASSPPGFIFPIVWTLLHILMGISSYVVYSSNSANKSKALLVYAIQLSFSFRWNIIFFEMRSYLFAFIWLIALTLIIMTMVRQFYSISPLAAYLQTPYLIWCIFVAYLNLPIFIMN